MIKRLSFWLVCGLFGFAGAFLYQSFHSQYAAQAATTPTWNTGRKYYLTPTKFPADQALNACAAGYHMASQFEIHEPTILKYDPSLGLTDDDSGSGPPTINPNNFDNVAYGWARTGFLSNAGNGVSGQPNCNVWTDNSTSTYGTVMDLNPEWDSVSGHYVVWNVGWTTCASSLPVWCVEN